MLKRLGCLAVILALVFAASMALADTVTLTETGVNPGTALYIHAGTLGDVGAQAGNYLLTVNGVAISGYCVEPAYSGPANQQYEIVPITSALNGTFRGTNAYTAFSAAAWLVGQGYTGQAAVAAQAAVWELTWDYAWGMPLTSLMQR